MSHCARAARASRPERMEPIMEQNPKQHPVDYFGPILGRYKALESMIDESSDPQHIRALLDAINETFEFQCDLLNSKEFP
jgi:hypothetical protein